MPVGNNPALAACSKLNNDIGMPYLSNCTYIAPRPKAVAKMPPKVMIWMMFSMLLGNDGVLIVSAIFTQPLCDRCLVSNWLQAFYRLSSSRRRAKAP